MRRRSLVVAALALGASAVIAGAALAWYRAQRFVSTDDAYVESTVVPVSAKVAGQVVEVAVRDNEPVEAGQVIARLDSRDYRARVARAEAAVRIAEERARAAGERVALMRAMAESQATQARASAMRAEAARQSAQSVLEASRATVKSRRAALASAIAERDRTRALSDRAAQDLARARELAAKDLVARQFVDHAEAEARAAAAQHAAAEERVAQAQRELESAEADARMREAGFEPQQLGLRTAEARAVEARAEEIHATALEQEIRVREAEHALARAQFREAEAELALARLDLDHADIRAPISGLVTRKTVEVGQVVQVGQPLLAVVSLDDVWVVANFKETQLRRVRAGLRADVAVDTYPDRKWSGVVDSIAAGTGARFSLLPPENATGNWVKVVQRVPVKIALRDAKPGNPHVLRAGMSAVVTIHLQ